MGRRWSLRAMFVLTLQQEAAQAGSSVGYDVRRSDHTQGFGLIPNVDTVLKGEGKGEDM